MAAPVIKVALVEDDYPFREAIKVLLNGTPGFRCVADYADGEAAWHDPALAKAQVVLVDIGLPGMNGIELVRRLKSSGIDLMPLMLTVYEDTERLFQSLTAGAFGYLLKRTPPAEILAGIQEVVAGGSPMSRSLARKVIQHFHVLPAPSQELALLTPREREILERLATGYIYKEIAGQLDISLETVKAHLRNIYKKLQVNSRAEAMLKVLQN